MGGAPPGGAPPPGGSRPPGDPQSPAGPRSPAGPAPPPGAGQPPGGYAPPPYGQPGYGGQGWQQPGAPEPGNGPAVAALVLGIVSLALLLVTAGLSTIVSLGCAIPAIFLGRTGRQRVDEGQTRKHRGLAQAGFIMGIVGTILSVLSTVFWVLLIALSEDFQDDFEREFNNQSLERTSTAVLAHAVAATARTLLG